MIPKISQSQDIFKPSALKENSFSEEADGGHFRDCLYSEGSNTFASSLQKEKFDQGGSFRGIEGEDSFSTREETEGRFQMKREGSLKDVLKGSEQIKANPITKGASGEVNQNIQGSVDEFPEDFAVKSAQKIAMLFQEASKGKGFKLQKDSSIDKSGAVDPELILSLQDEEMPEERGFSRDGREREASRLWTTEKSSTAEKEKFFSQNPEGKEPSLKVAGFQENGSSLGARIEGIPTSFSAWSPHMGVSLVEGAAPTAPIYSPPPVLLPVEQLAFSVRTAVQEGVEKFQINMRPPELGRVEAKIEISKDGSLKAVFMADNPEARDLLRCQAEQLAQILNESGFSVEAGDLQFSLRGEGEESPSNFRGDFEGSERGAGPEGLEDLLVETDLNIQRLDPNRALDVRA
ncbi:MAG: flagellar hook-length control protein FliK [bacterium]|nr:flagellar hook-length control protein FliK [bacterium]